MSTAHRILRKVAAEAKRARRGASRRILPAVTSRRAVVAEEAVVLDGRTLQLVVRLRLAQPGHVSGTVLFVRDNGSATHRLPVEIIDGTFQLAVALDGAGLGLAPGSSWSLRLECSGTKESIGFHPKQKARGPVLSNPPSAVDAITRSAAMGRTGVLRLDVSMPRQCLHADRVDTEFGRITILARAFKITDDPTLTVAYSSRDGGLRHTQKLSSSTAAHFASELQWQVPTAELASLTADAGIAQGTVWDMQVLSANGDHRIRKDLGDLRNPRSTFRYATVADLTVPGRDRFRPYWTQGGNLALEHWFRPRL